jgi:NMD protein affecting ribosome stability and mRNA decay
MNSIRLIQFPDVVEVVICSVCGSQQIKGKWQFPDSRSIEDLAAGAAADSVWLHHEFIHPNIEVDLRKGGATR